ncbi:Oxidoreductase NAD-binding domain-containing protein 1 [Podochytrium sp. JEL0797]|nr:Oxidoreductase NAD-binding domain-containing protein 1 [Podochytrium sp. JEL0797]
MGPSPLSRGLLHSLRISARWYSTPAATYSKSINTSSVGLSGLKGKIGDAIGLGSEAPRLSPMITASLKSIRDPAPNVKSFTFAVDPNTQLTYRPGQWIELSLPSHPTSPTAQFSISSAPTLPYSHTFNVTVKDAYQNPIVKYLHDPARKRGDIVHGRVGGSFFYKPRPPRGGKEVEKILFVAGGVGVAPLMAMMEHLVNEAKASAVAGVQPPRRIVTLMYSVRDEKELLFRERLEELCREYGGSGGVNGLSVEVQLFVTRYAKPVGDPEPTSTKISSSGVKMLYGCYVTPRLLSDYLTKSDANPDETVVYMCGPESLERAVYDYLKQLEFPLEQLHFEQWWT